MSDKINWIKSQLQNGERVNQSASRLNTPISVDNPVPQPMIPKPINLESIRSMVTNEEAFKVLNTLVWELITKSIKKKDYVSIKNHVDALLGGGILSETTYNKIIPILSETILDPDWSEKIYASPAQIAGYDLVLVSEVQQAKDLPSQEPWS